MNSNPPIISDILPANFSKKQSVFIIGADDHGVRDLKRQIAGYNRSEKWIRAEFGTPNLPTVPGDIAIVLIMHGLAPGLVAQLRIFAKNHKVPCPTSILTVGNAKVALELLAKKREEEVANHHSNGSNGSRVLTDNSTDQSTATLVARVSESNGSREGFLFATKVSDDKVEVPTKDDSQLAIDVFEKLANAAGEASVAALMMRDQCKKLEDECRTLREDLADEVASKASLESENRSLKAECARLRDILKGFSALVKQSQE